MNIFVNSVAWESGSNIFRAERRGPVRHGVSGKPLYNLDELFSAVQSDVRSQNLSQSR